MLPKTLIAHLLFVAALAGCAPSICAQEQDRPSPPLAGFEPLAEQVAGLTKAANVPAAALVIIDAASPAPGWSAMRAFGNADATTPFRLGSIGKTFTALALLHAAAATATPLDTSAAQIIGNTHWDNQFRAKHPISLGQLIELSAGFADISGAEFASAKPIERTVALRAHRQTHVTHWAPGQMHSYSNLPPAFSALAVEALTKENFEDYLGRHVLKPLGLTSASLQPVKGLPGGYKADGIAPIPYWHTIYPAFGGLNATPQEIAGFLLKLAKGSLGTELDAAKAHRGSAPLHQPLTTAAARAGLELGYGSGIYGWETGGHLFVGHGGDADGYRSRYAIMPQTKRGYLLVINTDNPGLLKKLEHRVEQHLTADLPAPAAIRPTKKTLARAHRHAQVFVGHYQRASKRFAPASLTDCAGKRARLSLNNNELLWHRGKRTRVLETQDRGIYRHKGRVHASVALVHVAGTRQLHGDLGNWVHADDVCNSDGSKSK